MKAIISLFTVFLLCVSLTVKAQENQGIDVNKDIDLAKVYEQVIKEGYGTPKVYLDLANAYYFGGDYANAKKWFEKVFETEELTTDMVVFRYKQSLKALKEDMDANPYLAALGTS